MTELTNMPRGLVYIMAIWIIISYLFGGALFLRLANKILKIKKNNYRNMLGITTISYLTITILNMIEKFFLPQDIEKLTIMAGLLMLLSVIMIIWNIFIKTRFLSYYTEETYGKALGAARISAGFMLVWFIIISIIIGIIIGMAMM
jgi:hypothetical protein